MALENLKDLHILVVDDHPDFLNLEQILLSDIGIKHIHTYTNAREALACFQQEDIDLCLLDIDLGTSDQNGILLAEKIRKTNLWVPIIYITSHFIEDYYQRCRHTRPSSFMNKELSRFKLEQAIDLALMNQPDNNNKGNSTTPVPQAAPYIMEETYYFKVGNSYKAFKLEEIHFFFAKDKMVFARVDNRNYPTNVKLKTLQEELQPFFLRIHKSYLINRQKIKAIHSQEDRVEIGGEQLPIGYAYKKDFFAQIRLLK